MAICRVCAKILTKKNWYRSDCLNYNNICSKCHNKRNKEQQKEKYNLNPDYKKNLRKYHENWRKEHPTYYRDMQRRQVLCLKNGKRVRVAKRPYLGYCEICGLVRKRLVYHHWSDEEPSNGIWACVCCHVIAEAIEGGRISGLIERYLNLKNKIEQKLI